MELSQLPVPLNLLQAAKATEVSSLECILPVLANAIGSIISNVDFSNFINKVIDFESNYLFWDECNAAFEKLNSFSSQIISSLKSKETIEIRLTKAQINNFNSFMPFLEKK
jgi:hypothetical protein